MERSPTDGSPAGPAPGGLLQGPGSSPARRGRPQRCSPAGLRSPGLWRARPAAQPSRVTSPRRGTLLGRRLRRTELARAAAPQVLPLLGCCLSAGAELTCSAPRTANGSRGSGPAPLRSSSPVSLPRGSTSRPEGELSLCFLVPRRDGAGILQCPSSNTGRGWAAVGCRSCYPSAMPVALACAAGQGPWFPLVLLHGYGWCLRGRGTSRASSHPKFWPSVPMWRERGR